MPDSTTSASADPHANDPTPEEVAAAMRGRDRAATLFGIDVTTVRTGYAECSMTVTESMLNGHDIAHGGVVFALADTAFAYACNSRNHVNVALDCSISFAAPARAGDRILATCQERTRGKRTGVYDVTVTRADGRTLAMFRGTCFQLDASVVPVPRA